jgi:hypothetical protein
MLCPAKVKTAACGRRWGKSESVAVDIVLFALENPNTIQFVIAPTDDQSKIIMSQVSRFLNHIPGMAKSMREVQAPYHGITFMDATGLHTGTTIKARTAGPTGRGIRGNKAHRVVLDESAYISDEIVDSVIGPLLADYDGYLVNISTPAGRNHFHRDYLLGLDPSNRRYASFNFPTSDNPYISREYLDEQQRSKPDRIYRQEYLAEFLDDAGGVFRGVSEIVDRGVTSRPARGAVSVGVDLAKYEDFTVLSAMDSSGSQVAIERFNHLPWAVQVQRIAQFVGRYPGCTAYVDATGVGDPIFEQLRAIRGATWVPYTLTNQSKEALINHLIVQIENQAIRLLDDPVQTSELQAYQYEITANRNIRMNAPSGMHDDTVIALALACWHDRQNSCWLNLDDVARLYS